jgi:hypothetical protein
MPIYPVEIHITSDSMTLEIAPKSKGQAVWTCLPEAFQVSSRLHLKQPASEIVSTEALRITDTQIFFKGKSQEGSPSGTPPENDTVIKLHLSTESDGVFLQGNKGGIGIFKVKSLAGDSYTRDGWDSGVEGFHLRLRTDDSLSSEEAMKAAAV